MERERERERKKEDEGGASGLRGGAAGSGDNGSLPRMAFGHYSPLSESHCHRHQCSVSPPMGLFFDGCEFSSLSLFFFLFPSKFQLKKRRVRCCSKPGYVNCSGFPLVTTVSLLNGVQNRVLISCLCLMVSWFPCDLWKMPRKLEKIEGNKGCFSTLCTCFV